MQVLVDHDIEGQAELSWGIIAKQGWCVAQLLEIAIDIEKYLGRGRVFIP